MPTPDVFTRLKQATTKRVQASIGSQTGLDTTRTPNTDWCDNCGQDALTVTVEHRKLVPDNSMDDGNYVALCDDCNASASTAVSPDADRTASGELAYDDCKRASPPIETPLVLQRDENRCRGCGVRESIVVGDDLHVHPVVPTGANGHRHPHNFVSVCPTCHRKLHD